MIKYNPKTWFDLIFHSYSRHVVKILMPSLIFMIIYTSLICYIVLDYLQIKYQSTTAFHSLMGIVLGLILVFRMNSAYDRWWEGRKQWGALVNMTRTLAMKVNAFIPEDFSEERLYFKMMIPNFVFSVKEHLRKGVIMEEIENPGDGFLEDLEKAKHKPNFISGELYRKFNELYRKKIISAEQMIILDKELVGFVDILGACERIRNTPIPYSFSMFIKKFIFTYIITLPFGFVTSFDYLTIPVVVLMFFILISIELISEEIEDPFGKDINDLPTDSLSTKIRNNIAEIIPVKS